jgi:Dolichyl-phosphate-mannose-protein mannosyltransferase
VQNDSRPRAGRRALLFDLGVIVVLSAAPLVALRPLPNVPFIDDWTYAWAVEHLLDTGRLKILDWSVSLNVVHVLWGALFCLPFGFSFTALRLSTWVLSLLGLVGLYVLLREMGARRRDSLVGVALVAFYPVYFILSFSFMTDVPFVVVVIWFFAALVCSRARESTAGLAAAIALACLAVAIRPLAVVLSGVLFLEPWPPSLRWRPLARRLVVASPPVVAVLLLTLARPALSEHRADLTWIEGSWAWRVASWRLDPLALPGWLGENLTVVVGTLGTALAPLALGSLGRETIRAAVPAGLLVGTGLAASLVLGARFRGPLDPEFTWSLRELGATEALVPPLVTPTQPFGWALGLTLVATVLLALAVMPLVQRRLPRPAMGLAWAALGYFVLTGALWLFYDRYMLPLVVIVTALRLGTMGIQRVWPALLGVALFAAISGVGTRDHLEYGRALWDAVRWARQTGIPDRDLDGGYVVNGWRFYAHPEHATRAPNGDIQVPWVNGGPLPRFGIVTVVPAETRVLHVVPYRRILARSGSLYVVDRHPHQSGRLRPSNTTDRSP